MHSIEAGLAQLVERLLAMQKVASSNLVSRSTSVGPMWPIFVLNWLSSKMVMQRPAKP
tara:strand:- start:760 stop:933 length:174 start_codon:yes stop_codon:yes gene_type:complete